MSQLGKSIAGRYAAPLRLRCAGAPLQGRSEQICGTAVEAFASNFRRAPVGSNTVPHSDTLYIIFTQFFSPLRKDAHS